MISCAIVAALVTNWVLMRDDFNSVMTHEFRGDLRRVSFQPHVDREFVTITDRAELAAIRASILNAKPLSFASNPPTTCSVEFEFADGRKILMKMSPTGITRTNFFQQNPATFRPLNYAILDWNGYSRHMDSAPFLLVLKHHDQIVFPSKAND